jgi:hypothetical protein
MRMTTAPARPAAPAAAVRRARRAALAYLGVLVALAGSAALSLVIPVAIAATLFVGTAGFVVWHCHPSTKPIRARRSYRGGHRP